MNKVFKCSSIGPCGVRCSHSFGKRSAACKERQSDCVTMESSTMIKVEYPDMEFHKTFKSKPSPSLSRSARSSVTSLPHSSYPSVGSSSSAPSCNNNSAHMMSSDNMIPIDLDSTSLKTSQVSQNKDTVKRRHRRSVSDPIEGTIDELSANRGSSSMDSEDDPDEDDLDRDGYIFKDTIREALEKSSNLRTEQDITNLVEFLQQLIVFTNMTVVTRRALCGQIQMCRVDVANTVVLNDGEELDSWSVLLNGHVEVLSKTGQVRELSMGESFGITATKERMYHQGTMTTRSDNCLFICIPQEQYANILDKGEENIKCIYDEHGAKIRYEEYRICDGGKKKGHVIIKGLKSALIDHLIETHSIMDPTYVDDFLLTYRTFIDDPMEITSQLLEWFKEPKYREKVIRVVLLWVNNHYVDFERNAEMASFLSTFELLLENENLREHLGLLNIACAVKACKRNLIISRNNRKEILQFNILGGIERGSAIFVSKVEQGSKIQDTGLKRGDQILEVNNHSFENISHHRALELLRCSTHIAMVVRSNLLAFKEMLMNETGHQITCAKRTKDFISPCPSECSFDGSSDGRFNTLPSNSNVPPFINAPSKPKDKHKYQAPGHKNRIRKALERINLLPKNDSSTSNLQHRNTAPENNQHCLDDTSIPVYHSRSKSMPLQHSTSNPDISSLDLNVIDRSHFQMAAVSQLLAVSGGASCPPSEQIQHVLKVYRADQTYKFFIVNLETTAHEVVMLALNEFGIVNEQSSNYSLFMVSVEPGMVIKQKRLPKQQANLPEKITLNARYYLKNNVSTELLIADDLVTNELVSDGQVSLLQLHPSEVAAQLTLRDFSSFSTIHSSEYIDDLFSTGKCDDSTEALERFALLANEEMFWVVTEICAESNIMKRMKIIKSFIRIAKCCKDCKNFNSMFALISGLGYGAVSRLRQTWDKLPSKYIKMFEDLQNFLDPTRNMLNYRNLINSTSVNPPSIPFFPIVKKDLTFIHLGNDTLVDGLVNFEKLRMVAKEIRSIGHMTSINYNCRDIYNDLSKRRRNSNIPNTKKIYEENHMIRRVRTYLEKLNIIKDENDLDTLSYQCECTNGGPRKREMTEASLTTKPIFGTQSPDAVRKLMSLSDKVRPSASTKPSTIGSKSTLLRLTTGQAPPTVLKMPPVSPRLRSLPIGSVRLSNECSSIVPNSKTRNSGSICSNDSRISAMSVSSSLASYSPLMGRTSQHGLIISDADSGHNSVISSTSSVTSSSELGQCSDELRRDDESLDGLDGCIDEESTLTRKSPIRRRPSIGSSQSDSSITSFDRPSLPSYHVLVHKNPAISSYIQQKFNTESSTNDVKELPLYESSFPIAPLYPPSTRRQLSEPQHKRVSMATARLYKHSKSKDNFSFKRSNLDEVLNDDDSQVSAV